MEWAESEVIAPGLPQIHIRRDELDDIDPLFDLVGDVWHRRIQESEFRIQN
jgi:hypothetical protein